MLVLSQHVAHTYAVELLADSAEGLGYLLKDRVTDVEEFTAAVAASPRAARLSTRSSWRSSSAAAAATIRSSGSRRASARCSN